MSNPVVRWQIVTPQPDDVGQFYTDVFGWRVGRDNPLAVRDISTGSPAGIPGGIWPAPPGAPTFVQLFVEVTDVAAVIASVERRGGSVIVPRSALPNGEIMAILRDPFGASFGIVQAMSAEAANAQR